VVLLAMMMPVRGRVIMGVGFGRRVTHSA
jgi:hypothetical protein